MPPGIDERALKILFDTYWSPRGWKNESDQKAKPADLKYAKSAGLMFAPVKLSHSETIDRAIAARDAISPEVVANGFLASLSTKRLDLRSALGSYAVVRLMAKHSYQPDDANCAVCGVFGNSKQEIDLNVLNFERFKWGGVRHDDPSYAWFDLEQFGNSKQIEPTKEDVRIFRELIAAIRQVPPTLSASALQKHLVATGFTSNKSEREVMIAILGYCGILAPAGHPSYFNQFVPESHRHAGGGDMRFPAGCWRGRDGINSRALNFYFGHLLSPRRAPKQSGTKSTTASKQPRARKTIKP
jgi:hypothetical protein